MPLPPPQSRKTIHVNEGINSAEFGEDITVVTYNILCDFYLQPALAKGRHKNCSKEYVTPKQDRNCPRHKLMMNELQWLDGDIVCLQEVDTPYFTEILKEDMSFLGYKGMFAQKSQTSFELEESKTLVINEIAAGVFTEVESNKFGEVLILAALRHKNSNTMLLTATTHILWKDLLEPVTQVCEIALVTQALRDMVTALRSQDKHVAYILCGDFNIDPHYPAYHLLKDGKLSEEQFCKLQTVDYLKFAADVEKPHQVLPEQISLLNKVKKHLRNPLTNMQSAYKVVMGSEPQCTSAEDDASRVWTIDYIWFDSENLKVTAALETLPESAIAAYRGFPNEYFSSDHFSLKAHFKFIVKP
ncbi:hypothetical protein OS493_034902 [Desmophyllum pertusum]|uniref:Nocturnin n=1 Tax=Desmophyllum pertusum TaxID=174260 RepID=A0A9W9Z703_9CNID|nr:hypothetical protein OS493_034902 [Desmophyllum pertusum]